MTKLKEERAWITQTDVSQWAIQYLKRRCIRIPDSPPAEVLFDRLHQVHTLKGRTDENLKLLERMRNAWRKQQSRNNRTDRKSHSFSLSAETGRQLRRLAADYGQTKAQTLEQVITDNLARENRRKAEKKDETVYKKRAAIFERHLDQALDELHEYKLRLDEAGINVARPLSAGQQAKVKSLSRSRKNEAIRLLPQLPGSAPRKRQKKPSTPTGKKRDQRKLCTPSKGSEADFDIVEQVTKGSSTARRAITTTSYVTAPESRNQTAPCTPDEDTTTIKTTAAQDTQGQSKDTAESSDRPMRAVTLREKGLKVELRIKKPFVKT